MKTLEAPALGVQKKGSTSFISNPTLLLALLRTLLALAIIIFSLSIQSIAVCQFSTPSLGSWENLPTSVSSPQPSSSLQSLPSLTYLPVPSLTGQSSSLRWPVTYDYGCITVSDILYIVVSVVVFFHHFMSAFGARLSLPGIVDLVLLVAESAIAIWALVETYVYSSYLDDTSGQNPLLVLTTMWAFVIILLLFAFLRIAITFKTKSPFNKVDVSMPEGSSQRSTPTEVLFGKAIWRPQFLNEQRWLIGLRGVATVLCMLAIVAYAYNKILAEPLRQISLTSVKDLRTRSFPDILYSTPIDFNVLLTHSYSTTANDIVNAVTVTKTADLIEVGCPATNFGNFYCGNQFDPDSEMPLQINVAVNFTVLLANQTGIDGISVPVKLWIGLTNNTGDVLAQTPILLVPGLNAVGQADFGIRQRYKTPAVFTFGLYNTWDTYYVAEMAYIYNNPNSTSILSDTSLIRIYLPFSAISEYQFTQDYTDSSVLNGFSATGGLWTFLGSIIALLFGRTIMQSIVGSKPLSIFGLLHMGDKNWIREGYAQKYPRLESDLSTEPREQGLLALIRDYLLDLDMFTSSNPKVEVEKGEPSEVD